MMTSENMLKSLKLKGTDIWRDAIRQTCDLITPEKLEELGIKVTLIKRGSLYEKNPELFFDNGFYNICLRGKVILSNVDNHEVKEFFHGLVYKVSREMMRRASKGTYDIEKIKDQWSSHERRKDLD